MNINLDLELLRFIFKHVITAINSLVMADFDTVFLNTLKH